MEKIRVKEGVVANKHDTRYIIGYEVEPGKIVPLYILTPEDWGYPIQQEFSVEDGVYFE